MAREGDAFGAPGIPAKWTHGDKSGVGTAYSASSRLWFTLFDGIVTELYHPTVDRPQLRDLQYLVSDGKTFVHEEKRDLRTQVTQLAPRALGYRCVNADPEGRYTITKTIITAPHQPCLLQRTQVSAADPAFLSTLKLYALCAPHLDVGGGGNTGYVVTANGIRILVAGKGGTWLAMAASVPFAQLSCGFVGKSDGWTDLHDGFRMDWAFEHAGPGNIALTGELDLRTTHDFTLGLAFGDTEHRAITNLLQCLGVPFEAHLTRYLEEWEGTQKHCRPLEKASCDDGALYRNSYSLLLAHEDKDYPGAIVASLSIPWGEAKGDDVRGGYHLVWTRDLVNSATALLAAGDTATPLRALIFLAVSQHADGGFAQNFWVTGEAHWTGKQLDEVAFPILLAARLLRDDALGEFDPYELVRNAASYLVRQGPVTEQERWEEASGYSPSTLAANIAALVCAAAFFRRRDDEATAAFVEEHADFLESHLEDWTVTHAGTLLPGTSTHYIRVLPEELRADEPATHVDDRLLEIKNLAPRERCRFPAKEVVDGGFLELVRYGIRAANDPIIEATVKVIDAVLKVETKAGPTWHRYNHDGYGQQVDGRPFTTHGHGGTWPLLTGERGHYELAAGHDPRPHLATMEQLASSTGLLSEQVWDLPDAPEIFMMHGKPTGSAMPLMWAHAEYVKLLRSVKDGVVFDLIPMVRERYATPRPTRKRIAVWSLERRVRSMKVGERLRIHGATPFRVRWTCDAWRSFADVESSANAVRIDHADLETSALAKGSKVELTIFWLSEARWEGKNYEVRVT